MQGIYRQTSVLEVLIAQLAAGSLYICSHFTPHRHLDMVVEQVLFKPFDAYGGRAQQMAFDHGIDGNEVDAGELSAQERDEFLCLLLPVVELVDENVFVRHAPLRRLCVMAGRLDDIREEYSYAIEELIRSDDALTWSHDVVIFEEVVS